MGFKLAALDFRKKLANLIYNASYVELTDVATDLYRMTMTEEGKEYWDLEKDYQWAQFLAAWAESQD